MTLDFAMSHRLMIADIGVTLTHQLDSTIPQYRGKAPLDPHWYMAQATSQQLGDT